VSINPERKNEKCKEIFSVGVCRGKKVKIEMCERGGLWKVKKQK
jgi:hypothetical protein